MHNLGEKPLKIAACHMIRSPRSNGLSCLGVLVSDRQKDEQTLVVVELLLRLKRTWTDTISIKDVDGVCLVSVLSYLRVLELNPDSLCLV